MVPGERVMVFAVQCPDPKCRKFMLVEEQDRGRVVPCLICKTPIRVGTGGGQPPTPGGPEGRGQGSGRDDDLFSTGR